MDLVRVLFNPADAFLVTYNEIFQFSRCYTEPKTLQALDLQLKKKLNRKKNIPISEGK